MEGVVGTETGLARLVMDPRFFRRVMRPCDRLLQAVQLVSIASLPVVAITRRYKELAKQLHPDKWGGPGDLPECILSTCFASFRMPSFSQRPSIELSKSVWPAP